MGSFIWFLKIEDSVVGGDLKAEPAEASRSVAFRFFFGSDILFQNFFNIIGKLLIYIFNM